MNYNSSVMKEHKLVAFYDRVRDGIYARYEMLFPTTIQVRLIQILGGTTITIGGVRRKNVPLTITLSRGKLLRSKRYRRAVVDGMGVLANDVQYAIAVEGPDYARDVVAAYERDEKLASQGWRVAYVQLSDIFHNPTKVRQNLLPLFK